MCIADKLSGVKHSPLRTPLAILRIELGLTQEKLGKLVGKARRTIQAIEIGKLRLTEDLAAEISEKTGISARWLLEGKPDAPMMTPEGEAYTKEVFDALRGRALREINVEIQDPSKLEMLYMRGFYVCADWFPMYSAAAKAGKREIAEYLTTEFLEQMRERFGFDFDAAQKIDAEVKFKSQDFTFSIPRRVKPPKNSPFAPLPANARRASGRKSS